MCFSFIQEVSNGVWGRGSSLASFLSNIIFISCCNSGLSQKQQPKNERGEGCLCKMFSSLKAKCWLQDNFETNKQFLPGYFDLSVLRYRLFSLMPRIEALNGPLAFTFPTISPRLLCHLPLSSFDLRRSPKINLLLAPGAVPASLSAPLSSILCSQGGAGQILAMSTPNLDVWVYSESSCRLMPSCLCASCGIT